MSEHKSLIPVRPKTTTPADPLDRKNPRLQKRVRAMRRALSGMVLKPDVPTPPAK